MFIKVRVFPNSKKQEIIKKSLDSFDVKLKEKPEKNLANKALFSILADYLQISKNKIKLVKGSKQQNKILKII
ncbi:MAG: DUF167 domain-containing protein [Candidatus Pacebacteria bacterium]|nr:DUF167 domain-containing protein [Candidatus Paceibacterota bacterium]